MALASVGQTRPLTNDEIKAAEAAFRGAPFNPKWSEAARKVYQGISAAMATRPNFLNLSTLDARTEKEEEAVVGTKSRTRAKSKIV